MKKSIMSLVVIGMTVSGAAGVYAGSNMQKITAYLNHSIGFKVNGAAYIPADSNGKKLAPITYQNTTYLPVRAIADALKVPVAYDSKSDQVLIGSSQSTGNTTSQVNLTEVKYSKEQVKEINKAFANFEHFQAAYAPQQMIKGDTYQMTGASDDSVTLRFSHMTVRISPRDYSDGYESKTVKLSNGSVAKWYTPSDTPMLGFKLDDRIVTISSEDHSLSKVQIEKVAVSVAKLK
ncbi:stalk domain-containing protein [Paenibacillus sp. IHBB 10380]|uniref:stalk domain-containing protein n=1 Tax=Paenibacillus sp. IHBB 10380 TaxID=1566358 RepID=UPI0005CFB186|nr:stalk domain-containing protein [Paenibacillus sp. IHBB 10380]AJS57240.1 hypothetical protein UB51_00585 [Paenibacillus sp. IHBB 10380]